MKKSWTFENLRRNINFSFFFVIVNFNIIVPILGVSDFEAFSDDSSIFSGSFRSPSITQTSGDTSVELFTTQLGISSEFGKKNQTLE